MIRHKLTQFLTVGSVCLLMLLTAATSQAVPVSFAVQQSQSTLTLDVKNANVFGFPLTIAEQATGSLKSSYTGTIATDITGSTIEFPTGGSADASILTSGIFKLPVDLVPGAGGTGQGPGDYGIKSTADVDFDLPSIDLSFLNIPGVTTIDFGVFKAVAVNAALRNVLIDVDSGPLTRSGTPGNTTFDSTQLNLLMSGNVDVALGGVIRAGSYAGYSANALVLGGLASALNTQLGFTALSVTGYNLLNFAGPWDLTVSFGSSFPLSGLPLPNSDASLGKLQTIAGNSLRLTVPISFDAIQDLSSLGALSGIFESLLSLNLGFSGSLVGTVSRTGLAIPEPASVVTLGIGLVALAGLGWKRTRRGF